MRLFFTGLKHSGKTTFARLSAEALNIYWCDADDLILDRIKPLSVREYYKAEGAEAFKSVEYKAVKEKAEDLENAILSLGGGTADNALLMEYLKSKGKIIYLTRPEELLLEKILEKNGIPPFLDAQDVKGSFHTLFLRRDGIYTQYADLIIDLGPYGAKEETLKKVLNELSKEIENGWK